MRNAAAGGRVMKAPFDSYLPTQPGDVISNPRNPENPDSKPINTIIFNLKPVGEKTRSIASLQGRILIIPDLGVVYCGVLNRYVFICVDLSLFTSVVDKIKPLLYGTKMGKPLKRSALVSLICWRRPFFPLE